jgi:hypothetical protein
VHRYFLAVPPGASTLEIEAHAVNKEFALARVELCDPEGRTFTYLRGLDTRNGVKKAETRVQGEDLVPGVWELMVYGDFRSGRASQYGIHVRFLGIEVLEEPALSLAYKPGKTPKGKARIMNRFHPAVWTTAEGEAWGYTRTRTLTIKDEDTYTYTFSLDESLSGVRFKISVSPEHYGLFTDFAINIKDKDGVDRVKSGLSYRSEEVYLANPGGTGNYTLKLTAGYTHGEITPFDLELEEAFLYKKPIAISVAPLAGSYLPLVPDIPTEVKYTLKGIPPVAPEGFRSAATITFTERGTEQEVFELDLREARK